jgi:hypothetical protein
MRYVHENFHASKRWPIISTQESCVKKRLAISDKNGRLMRVPKYGWVAENQLRLLPSIILLDLRKDVSCVRNGTHDNPRD